MAYGSIDTVLDELRSEGHAPMVRLVEALSRQTWIETLSFDLSMLRLWIARKSVEHVEAMIVYGDGRGGGLPFRDRPYVDAYELTFCVDSKPTGATTRGLADTIEILRHWLESAQRPSSG